MGETAVGLEPTGMTVSQWGRESGGQTLRCPISRVGSDSQEVLVGSSTTDHSGDFNSSHTFPSSFLFSPPSHFPGIRTIDKLLTVKSLSWGLLLRKTSKAVPGSSSRGNLEGEAKCHELCLE